MTGGVAVILMAGLEFGGWLDSGCGCLTDDWTGAIGFWLIDGLEVLEFGECVGLRCGCVADGWTGSVCVLQMSALELWVFSGWLD